MLSNLYPLSFLIALGALTSWFYFQDDENRSRLFRMVFFIAITLFGVSWISIESAIQYKFLMIGRELLILMVVPLFLSFFRKKKWVFIALLFAVLGTMDFFYFDTLKDTFPEKTEPQTSESILALPLAENGELLVELKERAGIQALDEWLREHGLTATEAFRPADVDATDLDNYYTVDIPKEKVDQILALKSRLIEQDEVAWVEYNEQYELSPLELLPQSSSNLPPAKYGLNDPGLYKLWGFQEMNIADLYPLLNNKVAKKKALIAILDTGIDASHEDIAANYQSTLTKHDNDPRGHGTHCAGIAAAVSNNGKGVASFSQTNDFVKVTSIKVLSSGGIGTQKTIIAGMLEAADAGADVISMSLGGLSNDSRQRAYQKAVAYANGKGAIVVVAAGNSNRDARDFTPANVKGVIAVSAVDTLLNRANFSNKVDQLAMGIAAPGVQIYSTFPNDEYRTFNGTSMAAPYVAGLVGLMKSFKPDINTTEAFRLLFETGMDTKGAAQTGPLIQPASAIEELLQEQ